jgi:hypothetical protein
MEQCEVDRLDAVVVAACEVEGALEAVDVWMVPTTWCAEVTRYDDAAAVPAKASWPAAARHMSGMATFQAHPLPTKRNRTHRSSR